MTHAAGCERWNVRGGRLLPRYVDGDVMRVRAILVQRGTMPRIELRESAVAERLRKLLAAEDAGEMQRIGQQTPVDRYEVASDRAGRDRWVLRRRERYGLVPIGVSEDEQLLRRAARLLNRADPYRSPTGTGVGWF